MIENPDFNISCFPAFYVVSLPSNSKPPSQGGFFRHILKKKRSYPRKNSKYCNFKSPYSRKKFLISVTSQSFSNLTSSHFIDKKVKNVNFTS